MCDEAVGSKARAAAPSLFWPLAAFFSLFGEEVASVQRRYRSMTTILAYHRLPVNISQSENRRTAVTRAP